MLEIHAIDVFYGDLQALWGVSLNVQQGEIVSLVGPNGAGKSTLMKTISGLLRPASGKISFDSIPLDKVPAYKIVELGICMVPEGGRLFSSMSVLENLELGAFNIEARKERFEALERVYEIFPVIKARKNQMAGTLSGGEQQMLAIGRALMSQPKLLLLDEISLGLAPLLVQSIFQVIKMINDSKQIPILLVEQNVRMALELGGRGYIIETGRIVGHDEAQRLLESEKVKKAYLGLGEVRGEP
jgi:branched-chain amino acid transport system ATP-binding protein